MIDAAIEFALFDTAIGRCAIAWSPRGITAVRLPEGSPPVVMVTADPEAHLRDHRWVLMKPYRPAELVAAVNAALADGAGDP